MRYDPANHHRRSIRLRGYDYSLPGAYFVTICVRDRQCVFGDVLAGRMQRSRIGDLGHAFWINIPDHVPHVVLDAFIVMPNHVHGIIGLTESSDRNRRDVQLNVPTQSNVPTPGSAHPYYAALSPKRDTLSVIIRTYKGAVTRWCRRNAYPDFAWQPRFSDHIIRSERALKNIRRYIAEHPMRWHLDKLNPGPRGST